MIRAFMNITSGSDVELCDMFPFYVHACAHNVCVCKKKTSITLYQRAGDTEKSMPSKTT